MEFVFSMRDKAEVLFRVYRIYIDDLRKKEIN